MPLIVMYTDKCGQPFCFHCAVMKIVYNGDVMEQEITEESYRCGRCQKEFNKEN